jgi:REP-associated tyrosine transposase
MARSRKDRDRATAIQADDHLHQCVAYIDLNMMRAGVVKHPREWENSEVSRDSEAA